MGKNILHTAARLYSGKKYAQVIKLLESHTFSYRTNAEFYQLLGFACLKAGDLEGASSYLQRSQQLDEYNPTTLSGLAIHKLLTGSPDQAIEYWLDILKRNDKHKGAKTGLQLLKTGAIPHSLDLRAQGANSRVLKHLIPTLRLPLVLLYRKLIILSAASLFILIPIFLIVTRTPPAPQITRRGEEQIELALSADDKISLGGTRHRYVINAADLQALLDTVRVDFQSMRDNAACRNINYILHSNASNTVKQRMNLLATYLAAPTFVTLDSSPDYQAVKTEPWLYNGCHIRWMGQTANIISDNGATTFDFLVGYEDNSILDGLEKALLTIDFAIAPSQSVEVIGKILSGDDIQIIEVIDIRPLY